MASLVRENNHCADEYNREKNALVWCLLHTPNLFSYP